MVKYGVILMGKSWKDYLLKSGLPLENDVKNYLDSKGCIASFEYSYLRRDESEIEKEFSYDIDASYIKEASFIDLMVECKYRHETTKWIFTPQAYGGTDEIDPNCFMHPSDHFVSLKFPFKGLFPEQLAQLCSKGVEVTTSGDNEKTITQAISQLCYAFAPKIVNSIEHQIKKLLVDDYIFYHVPVIATTAELYRLKDDVDIDIIKSASNLEEISEKHNCLVLKHPIGTHLEKYNSEIFREYLSSIEETKLAEKLCSFTDDLSHLFSVLAAHYSPQAIVIVHYSKQDNGFDSLFEYIDRLIKPPVDLIRKLKKQEKRFEKIKKKWDSLDIEQG